MTMIRFLFLSLLSIQAVLSADYGLDCSFPIHNEELSCGDLLGDRKTVYDDFMQGCRDFYGKQGDRCDITEKERIEMSIRQPQSVSSSKLVSCPLCRISIGNAHPECFTDEKLHRDRFQEAQSSQRAPRLTFRLFQSKLWEAVP